VEPLLALADASIIVLSGAAGGLVYQLALTGHFVDPSPYAGLAIITTLAHALGAHHFGLYRLQELFRRTADYLQITISWAIAVFVLTVFLFLFKLGGSVSRGSVICFAGLGWVCLLSWRIFAKQRLRRGLKTGSIRGRRALVLGTDEEVALVRKADLLVRFGLNEIERVLLPGNDSHHPVSPAQGRAVRTAMHHCKDLMIEEVVVAVPWDNPILLEFVRDHFRLTPLPIQLLPDRTVRSVLDYQAHRQPLLVEIQRAPLSYVERAAKRSFDVVIATCSLVMLAPLMIMTAAAIKLDSAGPIIFRQTRHGFNGREFAIYKFRTMTVLEDGPIIEQAKKDDRRVTKLGRILRQTSIDELPQLFNVIKGDMSLVGPRPHALAHDNQYGKMIANYAFRHHVKPGITGWAQISGYRGETARLEQMKKRVDLDLWYVSNWGILLDLQILVRTGFELMRRRNAY
jgi:undecaprenyl-phosphate galactose phosphotransferase/putative colanic acid biosynthesis UDP-glucose lipid carrier transferase